jgi:hypothetical protein
MAVDPAFVDEVRRLEAELRDDGSPLVFESLAEVFGFAIARVRAEGCMDEGDACEALARAARLDQAEVRKIIAVLAPLGYKLACDRLRRLARRKRCS